MYFVGLPVSVTAIIATLAGLIVICVMSCVMLCPDAISSCVSFLSDLLYVILCHILLLKSACWVETVFCESGFWDFCIFLFSEVCLWGTSFYF